MPPVRLPGIAPLPRMHPRLVGTPVLAAAVFVFALGTYAFTASRGLDGYEPETAAVTEGFARTGEFRIVEDSPLAAGVGFEGKDGELIGRVGLPQPLLEAPFYLVGWAIDAVASGSEQYRYRRGTILLYNPFVLALVAVLILLIMLRVHGSTAWSIVIAALFTLASMAWPYSKIGMDTTATLGVAIAFFGAVAARDADGLWPWWTAGFGAGLAVAAKQYELPVVAAMGLLMWPGLRVARRERLRRVGALLLPFLAWMAAMAWYNWSRLGSATETGNADYEQTLAAPLNAIGFLVSPGKGLVWYSPLVVLGVLGLVALWRRDRRLALTIAIVFVLGVVFVALTPHWTDETWGPRYLLPVAWLLLIPIPWWVTTRLRQRVLGTVAVLSVAVQLVAILVPYAQTVRSTQALTGYPLYQQRGPGVVQDVPFGRDSVRWIPQLSPLLIQGSLVVSRIGQELGAPPITLRYEPFEGQPHKLVLSERFAAEVGFVDLWWTDPRAGTSGWLAVVAALAALGSAAFLTAVATGRTREAPTARAAA
jgi:hypothetical protein